MSKLLSISSGLLLILFLYACEETTTLAEESGDEEKELVINVPEGFELEDLYAPSENDRGSWVSLTEGPGQTLFACDQYGHIYQFPIPEVGAPLDTNEIKKIKFPLGRAHSLLWAFNSLYVVVNGETNENFLGSGIYKLTHEPTGDEDSEDEKELNKVDILIRLDGSGEHGPHSLILSPDGQSLFFLAGNHTKIPKEIQQSRIPMNWSEDNLFPQFKDARGHAAEIEAPGGWIAQTDPNGESWELYSVGYRNPFDIAFNQQGDLFTFDADMEWDLGMPWYRPVRVCHVTSGSEYGWRTGSGKWPVYYPDNLSPVINLGQGSPTGIFMGAGLTFPTKYQEGLFVMDWSFGTIYFVDLQQEGSTYVGTSEEFLTGTPLPLTDAMVGQDGHLYFATGGRRLESHLYRLRYVGSAATDAPATKNPSELVELRRFLESFHGTQTDLAIEPAWNNLDHEDRFVRYAARLALENQAVSRWAGRVFSSGSIEKTIHGTIALARVDAQTFAARAINTLNGLDHTQMSPSTILDLLRAYSLVFMRLGEPSDELRTQTIAALTQHFPAQDIATNQELARLLVFLNDGQAIGQIVTLLEDATNRPVDKSGFLSDEATDRHERYGKTIKKMLDNMPPADAIHYALTLSFATEGWNDALWERYFTWFYNVFSSEGGMSFKGFMDKVRLSALKNVPEDKRQQYEELSGIFSPTQAMADLPEPKGPGKDYAFREIGKIVGDGLKDYDGSPEQGRIVYQAALCESCHRFGGNGGNAGPDLTQIHTRFKRHELLWAIYNPHEEISDQYAFNLYTLNDGSKRAGRFVEETNEVVTIQPNAYDATFTMDIPKSDIAEEGLSPISPMPPGLLNRLNESEIVDLMAFLLSGGDEDHEIYSGDD